MVPCLWGLAVSSHAGRHVNLTDLPRAFIGVLGQNRHSIPLDWTRAHGALGQVLAPQHIDGRVYARR